MLSKIFRKKSDQNKVLSGMKEKQTKYEALVNAYHKDMYRYAYWLTHDAHTAEDVVQETFLRAWKSLDSLKDLKAAKSWLITILRRENARRFERKQFVMGEYEEQNIIDHNNHSDATAEQYMLKKQIAKLPDEYRDPLVLQIIMGMSGDEIADSLNLNKNTVMTRLFRARNMLKEAFEGEVKSRSING
ncbi:sigma-70 family RNA polymerase sigma factor [Gayadomonas joobiniege]|uniref:sigma-70 family RNA polymerase sigma factor n=1 Tax=Gayadomonas joobiniege TaxID=1234606 RepID=UPI00036B40F6|nr:sigma-70 family RNA polymerase sigma factor [Gayadomonas joobiniege]